MVNDKPAEVLSTNKIKLQKYGEEKANVIFEQIEKTRERLEKQVPWLKQIQNFPDFQKYVKSIAMEWERGESYRYAIFDHTGHKYIGHIGVHNIRYQSRSCSLGYWLLNDYQAKGYISDSIRLVERAMFNLGFKEIEIGCYSHNKAAHKIPQMLNYKLARIVSEGQSNESLIFSKLAS